MSIGPTDLCVQPAMLLYILYAYLTGHGIFALVSILSILLHEGAHASAAALLGHPPHAIELSPLGAVMQLDEERILSTRNRLLMLLAGPAMTLLLCGLAYWLTKATIIASQFGRILFMGNLSILILNLLPALPLDGGRILTMLLERIVPISLSHRIMRAIGSLLGMTAILLNILVSIKHGGWNLSLAFTGCWLLYSAAASTTTQAMAELRCLLDRKVLLERKNHLDAKLITCLHTQSLRQLIRLLPSRKVAIFCCVEAGSMKTLGWMTEWEMIQQYMEEPERRFDEALSILAKNNRKFSTN